MDVDDCLRRSCEPMQEESSTLAIDADSKKDHIKPKTLRYV